MILLFIFVKYIYITPTTNNYLTIFLKNFAVMDISVHYSIFLHNIDSNPYPLLSDKKQMNLLQSSPHNHFILKYAWMTLMLYHLSAFVCFDYIEYSIPVYNISRINTVIRIELSLKSLFTSKEDMSIYLK